jgi:hypothetical protein
MGSGRKYGPLPLWRDCRRALIAEKVIEVSGRGVGMDAVANAVRTTPGNDIKIAGPPRGFPPTGSGPLALAPA